MKSFFWKICLPCSILLGMFSMQSLQAQQLAILPDADTIYVCPDSTLVLIASGGSAYKWSSPTISIADSGNDTVKVKSNGSIFLVYLEGAVNGLKQKDSVFVISATPQLNVQSLDASPVCRGKDVRLRAITNTGGYGLVWQPADGLSSVTGELVIARPKTTTTYTAILNITGCEVRRTVTVSILPPQVDIAQEDTVEICLGTTLRLQATTNTGNAQGLKWTSSDGLFKDTLKLAVDVKPIVTTKYYTTFSNGGCVITDSVYVKVDSLPKLLIEADPKKDSYCQGELVTLKSPTYEPFLYPGIQHKWFPDKGFETPVPEQNISCLECKNPRVNPTSSTSYTITVTEKGCPSSKSVPVSVLQPPLMPIAVNPTICRGDSITLFLANPEPGVNYRWVSPQIPSLDATIARLRVAPTSNTTYSLTAQRGRCPSVTAQTAVNVIQPADVNVPAAQRVCPGQSVTLTATGTAPSGVQQSFLWTWNNGQNSSTGATVTVNNLRQSTVFNMTYIYGPNCGVVTKSVQVTVEAVPAINGFVFNPAEAPIDGVVLGTTVTVNAQLTPPSPSGVTYSWKANNESIPGTASSVQHTPSADPTTYTLTVKTNSGGCEVSATSPPIRVLQPEFDIPNAFTPDGDENNDFFRVVFTGNIQIKELRVWNRWGQTVYNNDNGAQGWDGRVNGKLAPSDVYVYKAVIVYPDGREFVRQGDVTLIR
ncbi:MAG: gliding motility-associated C-terminal domain-containing protein [Haliscomenobacter sp.]|nr:gliding motility-associated C-terminal domain-containing protein [Haliscomenobacter sp.]